MSGQDSIKVKGISTDSRTIQPDDLFVAVPGPHFDGHDFIEQVIKRKSAVAILLSDKKFIFKTDIPIIWVKDTVYAFGHIARFHRDRFSIPVIALTGSAGKTTTKELIAGVLESRFKVLKNVVTENNHMGVPKTLLQLDHTHEIAVIEMGTNRFGDIRWLTQIAHPTVSVLTNIGESHLEFLKTPAGVFKEKFELIKHMKKDGSVIINGDDKFLRKILKKKLPQKIFSYGIKNKSDFQAAQLKIEQNQRVNFTVNRRHSFQLNTPVTHNVYNALAAVACGRLFKMTYPQLQNRIRQFAFPKGRQLIEQRNGVWVIDDTYNANPVSVRSALQTLNHLDVSGRKIFVCADMLELGSQSKKLHADMGRLAARMNVNVIITIGEFARFISESAKKMNKDLIVHHCETIDMTHQRLKEYCQPGDLILVKGSRGMKMERTIRFLLSSAE